MAKPGVTKQSERAEKADRLLVVSRERKVLEKEEESLKAFFKKDCGGVPMVYSTDTAVVETGVATRTAVNTEAVRADHGTKYDVTTPYMTVVAREKPKEAAK